MGKKIHIFEKVFWALGHPMYLFKIKFYLFCSKIEDLLIWLKTFKLYLHDPVIILASESLLRPKKQNFGENFPKVHENGKLGSSFRCSPLARVPLLHVLENK